MTAEERAQLLITARMLEAVGRLDLLSAGLTLMAAAAMLFGASNSIFAGGATIVLGVVVKLYGIRIAFDAVLLRDIACRIRSARRFLNYAADHYLHRVQPCWAPGL